MKKLEIQKLEIDLWEYEQKQGRRPDKIKLSFEYCDLLASQCKNGEMMVTIEGNETIFGIPFEKDKLENDYEFVINS